MPIATKNKNKAKEVENKDSPWTKLGISVDLSSSLTRQVLIEKFSFEKAKEIEMRNFFLSKIDGCELFTHSSYTDSVFYVKNKNVLMEKNKKHKHCFIKNNGFWSVFSNKYKLSYYDVKSFTQNAIEEFLKIQEYETGWERIEDCKVL